MVKRMHSEARKAAGIVARKATAGRSAYVMDPEYLSEFKNSEEGRHAMCKAVEEFAERRAAEREALGRAEGEARGEARGERKGRRETMFATAKRMLKDGILALRDIARYSGLSLVQVKKLQAELKS